MPAKEKFIEKKHEEIFNSVLRLLILNEIITIIQAITISTIAENQNARGGINM